MTANPAPNADARKSGARRLGLRLAAQQRPSLTTRSLSIQCMYEVRMESLQGGVKRQEAQGHL